MIQCTNPIQTATLDVLTNEQQFSKDLDIG